MGIAYTYGQDIERDEPLPEIPPLEIRNVVSGTYIKDKLKPEIVVRYVMKQSRVSREFGENITPDFVLLDLKVGYAIFDNLKLNAGIKNVFNKTYYEHLNRIAQSTGSQIFAPGRSLYLNANFLF